MNSPDRVCLSSEFVQPNQNWSNWIVQKTRQSDQNDFSVKMRHDGRCLAGVSLATRRLLITNLLRTRASR